MKKTLIAIPILFIALNLSAAELYMKKNDFFTELILTDSRANLQEIIKGRTSVTLRFSKALENDFSSTIDGERVYKIESGNSFITFHFRGGINYAVLEQDTDIKIVASKERKVEGISLGFGFENPVLKKGEPIAEDMEAESALADIDRMLQTDNYDQTLETIRQFLQNQPNPFYQQEGLYRLGLAYYNMGELDRRYYVAASQVFEEFLKLYPDSYKTKDVMMKSADAKFRVENYQDAILQYEDILKVAGDEPTRKKAYDRISLIHRTLGAYDKAINYQKEHIAEFGENIPERKAVIAVMQDKRGADDAALNTLLEIQEKSLDYRKLSPADLYDAAELLNEKNQHAEALKYYNAVYNTHRSSDLADMAIYKAAVMNEKLGNSREADQLFMRARQLYGNEKGGMLASVAYADKHIDERTSIDWEEFLENELNSTDFDVVSPARLVIIKALYREKDYDGAERMIARFNRENYGSQLLEEVNLIRQKILLDRAREAKKDRMFDRAGNYAQTIVDEYPGSPLMEEAKRLLQDIQLAKLQNYLADGKYSQAIRGIEDYYAQQEVIYDQDAWMTTLDDAYYGIAKDFYEKENFERVLVYTGQYFVNIGEGRHYNEMLKMYKDALLNNLRAKMEQDNYLDIIRIYRENESNIQKMNDQAYKDSLNNIYAFALYKSTLKNKARSVLAEVENQQAQLYLVNRVLLAESGTGIDVNKLDDAHIEQVIDELENTNVDRALSVLDQYTANPKKAAQLKYRVSRNVFNNIKREEILLELYNDLRENEDIRFEGSDEVFLSIGVLYYNRNNFASAVTALEQFIVMHQARDDKRAEGMYYLGKSLLKQGKREEAVENFVEITESIQGSVYANAAKNELSELNWWDNLDE